MKIRVGETKRRGEVIETVIYDITRVDNPVHASVFQIGSRFVAVPKDDNWPVTEYGSFNEAVGFTERLIVIEDHGDYAF